MAATALTPTRVPPLPGRIMVEEYHRLMSAGVIPENGRQELICGILVGRPTINPPHAVTIGCLNVLLILSIGTRYAVRNQTPITLPPDTEPIPDFVIATGPPSLYSDRHPGPGDIKIVIEVTDTSRFSDRIKKLKYYAEAKLPEYWIVNIPDYRVEVYTEPHDENGYSYRTRKDYTINDSVPVIVDSQLITTLLVRDIFSR